MLCLLPYIRTADQPLALGTVTEDHRHAATHDRIRLQIHWWLYRIRARLGNQGPKQQDVEHLKVAPRLAPVQLFHVLPKAAGARTTVRALAVLQPRWATMRRYVTDTEPGYTP